MAPNSESMARWLLLASAGIILDSLSNTEGATITPTCSGRQAHTVNANNSDTVVLRSPNYPRNYGQNKKCQWNLVCDYNVQGTYFEWHCDSFLLERPNKKKECQDSLSFEANPRAATIYCGSNAPPDLNSASGIMEIIFDSDRKKSYSGFSCTAICRFSTATTSKDTTTTNSATRMLI